MTDKVNTAKNYTSAQEAIIAAAIAAAGGRSNRALAEALCERDDMRVPEGQPKAGELRGLRSMTAKLTRLGTYDKAPKLSKTGKPVASKADIVAEIAAAVGVTAASIAGFVNAPKLELETFRDAVNGG